jgi:hypothetical protein
MPSQSTNVFVSYSHADAPLVAPVVRLLRINKSLVFQDVDGIEPGKRWRSELARALAEAHLVVVFWCDHASRSTEVSKEWKAAIKQKKDLLPLLLDATPLPPALDEFQWIDFRGTVGANHSSIDSSPVKSGRPPRWPAAPVEFLHWLSLAGLAATFATHLVLSVLTWQSPGPARLPPSAEPFDFVLSILPLLSVIFAVTACLAWLLRRRSKRETPSESVERSGESVVLHERDLGDTGESRPYPGEIERLIANELEAEILRRTGLRRDDNA